MTPIEQIAIIGAGNVGGFLRAAFEAMELAVIGFSRSESQGWLPLTDLPQHLAEIDLLLICVNDDNIGPVSAQVPANNAMVAHVSGAMGLSAIDEKHSRRAVFYPLMSLNHNQGVPVSEIPFCLEAESPADLPALETLVQRLDAQSRHISSAQRRELHLAAVLAQNFSNHLHHKAYQLLAEKEIDFKLLLPLLENSLRLLRQYPPGELQTGPARRNDQKTIAKHLEMLSDPNDKELYQMLTQSIINTYGKEL